MRLASYVLGERIGRGGMGVVYRATHVHLGREVALKVLAPELTGDQGFRRRFLLESRLAASLDHPNIVDVYDAGESDGTLYIAMRYVHGTDLARFLAAHAPLQPDEALAMLAQVGAALDAAHLRGLTHRDVKPANVLIAEGRCYLADFGLTKLADRTDATLALTRTGQVLGTIDYVAPEQIEGRDVDGRADVYSLTCMLYECLTGSRPFPKGSDLAIISAHLHDPPPCPSHLRPDLPAALDAVVARGMAKAPAERYATGSELLAAAHEALLGAHPAAGGRAGSVPGTAVSGTAPATWRDATPAPSNGDNGRRTVTDRAAVREPQLQLRAKPQSVRRRGASRERVRGRRRRQVPGWALYLLSPVFRYHDERGAWIMRLIGNRFGPVLLGPVRPVSPVPLARGRPRLTPRRALRLLVVALGAAAALAGAGYALASRGVFGGGSATNEQTVSAQGVQLAVPRSWRHQPPTVAAGLGLSSLISVGPSGPGRETLVVGRSATPDPQLLPRPLLAALAAPPTPQAVRLGRVRFFRYRDLVPRGQRVVESVYALPTTAKTLVGICAAAAPGSGFVVDCERALATVQLRSARALPLGPDPHYASILNQVVSQLNETSRRASATLLTAGSSTAQAGAAATLAAADARAAAALARLNPGPAAQANQALVSALKQLASAYSALARAATAHDAAAYSAARAAVDKAARALTAAYAGLSRFGYTAG